MNSPDDFNPFEFRALCNTLGIKTHVTTDAFGRTDLAIDRDGLNKLIAAGLLPEDPSELPAFKRLVERRQQKRGRQP